MPRHTQNVKSLFRRSFASPKVKTGANDGGSQLKIAQTTAVPSPYIDVMFYGAWRPQWERKSFVGLEVKEVDAKDVELIRGRDDLEGSQAGRLNGKYKRSRLGGGRQRESEIPALKKWRRGPNSGVVRVKVGWRHGFRWQTKSSRR